MNLYTQGYTLLKGVYTAEEIRVAKEGVLAYSGPLLDNANGRFLPDFIGHPELAAAAALKDSPIIAAALDAYYEGQPYHFCGHSDVAINRVVSGWHKDILNGPYVRYQRGDPWSPDYKILKLGIYLQDHSDNNDALQVVPGSHLRRDVEAAGAIRLRPAIGDAILFDQRITHRGMERQVPGTRIMLSFGFGADNEHTAGFEEGTRARQRDQLRAL
jgi:ectoine hydroxylase-related dioxygenase (phytanoyl-CoA dioxygenase family)